MSQHPLTPDRRHSLTLLASIPRDVLPDGPARDALIMLIEAGAAVEVYHLHNAADGWWRADNVRLYIMPALPSWDGRMTPSEFLDAYAVASAYDTRDLCGAGISALADDLLALWESNDLRGGAPPWRPPLADAYEHAMGYLLQRLIAWHILPRYQS